MIWHLYNSSNIEKVIMTDSPHQIITYQHNYTPSISSTDDDEDASKTYMSSSPASSSSSLSSASSSSSSLFLNFTSNLDPQKPRAARKKQLTAKKTTATASVKVNGTNILNRKNVDSKTVVERIQRRRENHNHVERRRRDSMNHTITKLSEAIPSEALVDGGQKLNKHNVLKSALNYILYLQSENTQIKQQMQECRASVPSSPYGYHNSRPVEQHYHRPGNATVNTTIEYTEFQPPNFMRGFNQ